MVFMDSFLDLLKKCSKAIIFFSVISAAAVIFGVGVWYYISPAATESTGDILGVKADGLDLFSNQARLVRTAGDPTVYVLIGNKKHRLRNEEVFYSYDYDFKDVKIVGEQELDKYETANLVRDRTTGKIYFLSYNWGMKKYHPSPEAFNAYSGNRWEDVVTVSHKDLAFWPDVELIKTADDSKVYFVKDGDKAWIPSEKEFNDAGFNWNGVVTVAKKDLESYKTIEYNSNLLGGKEIPGLGQLIVSIDSSSPEAKIFPYATRGNILSSFKFQAVRKSVKINGLTFSKQGILPNHKIISARLEDNNGVRYGMEVPINNQQVVFNFSKPITILKDSQKIINLKASFASGSDLNNTVSFGINKEDGISSDAEVGGVFPVFGSVHKLVPTQNLIGRLEVESLRVNEDLKEVNLGAKNQIIAKFRFKEKSGNEKVEISKITLTNWGSIKNNEINNVGLYKKSKKLALVKDISNSRASFNIPKGELVIKKNSSVELEVRADILKGENSTLKFVIEERGDIEAAGLSQGFNLSPESEEGFPVGRGSSDGYNKIIIKREGFGFFAVKLKDSEREIYREQDSILGKFELRNIESDVYLKRMKMEIEKFKSAPDFKDDIIIKNKISRKKSEEIISVPASRVSGGLGDFNLGNYKVGAGDTLSIEVAGKVPEGAAAGNAYRIFIKEITYNISGGNREYTEAFDAYGQLMLVYAPSLTLTKGELENGGTAEAGEDKIELARFKAEAGVDEKIKIISATFSLTLDSDDVTYIDGFSNLGLYKGRSKASEKIEHPNSRLINFSNLKISVSAGKNVDLIIKADSEIISTDQNIQFKLDSIEAIGYYSKAPVIIAGEGIVSGSVTVTERE